MKTSVALLVLLAGFTRATFADGFIVIQEPVAVPPGHYRFAPLEVVYHHVTVKIDGPIATTTVDEEFYNPNAQRLEGTYLFPVPKGAQLDKFSMEVNGKMLAAELLPAGKARQIYEDIVRHLRDPALLEYADRDTFKVRIFPIEPRSNKRVTLSYSEVLKSDGGLVGYTYPLNTEKFSAQPIRTVSVKVELAAHRPIKSIYSPSHDVDIHRHGRDEATIGFEAKNVRPDTDFQLFFACEKDELGLNLMTYRTREDPDGYFLLLASPGADGKEPVVLKDVAFVVDTSGSMAGPKLVQAKKALQFCVDNLNEGDRFEIIRFATETAPLFEKLVDATADNRRRAAAFIQDLKPMGGTAIAEALLKALQLREGRGSRPYVVIVLTDGQPTIGETREEDILASVTKANPGNTRIFCFGIGTDVNTHLLDKITEATRAVSQYVLPEEDLEVKVSSFYTKIKAPVLAEVKLMVTGDVRLSKVYPAPLPDLFRGDQLVVAGRYSGQGSAAVVIEGNVNGARKRYAYDVSFPETVNEHEFIPRLWATRRVGYLLDEIRLHGESPELRDEVSDLARRYNIVTPYTAYLIVEDERQRNIPMAGQSFQGFGRDDQAREQAREAFQRLNAARDGDGAVLGARSAAEFKSAVGSGGFARGQAEATRSLAPVLAGPVAGRIVDYAQQSRFVNGRAFFQNGAQWIDANVQRLPNARRVRVRFGTEEYFQLLRDHPEALPWFALGRNVQVAIGGTVYEVTDAE